MRRYLLPASALFLLLLAYISYLGPRPYQAVESVGDADRAVVVGTSDEAARLGIHTGTILRTRALSLGQALRSVGYYVPYRWPAIIPVVHESRITMVVVPAAIHDPDDTITERIITALSTTFALLLAAYLGWRKPGAMIFALVLYLAGALSPQWFSPAIAGLPDPLFIPIVLLYTTFVAYFPMLALASFAIRFPGDEPSAPKRRAIRIIDAIVIAGFFVELVMETFGVYASRTFTISYQLTYEAIAVLTVAAATVLSLRFAQPSQRGRVTIVFAAIMLGGVGYGLGALVTTLAPYALGIWNNWYFTAMTVVVPLAVAYAILRHRVFDMTFVLNRTLVFAATSAIAVVALAVLEFLAETLHRGVDAR